MSSSKKDPPKDHNSQLGMPVMPGETPPPEDPDEEFRKKQQAVFNLVTVGGIVIATRYGTLKKMVPTGYNANHLNQDAAYRDVIPYNEGLANPLQGNPNIPGSAHAKFHESLNRFWRPYQQGGEKFGQAPTNAQYGEALEEALKEAGVSPREAAEFARQARVQRNEYGLSDTTEVPRIPGAPR
jgi:hypothetical protein